MSEQPASALRQQLEPAAADAVRAYAAKTRATADQFAGVLEDLASNGLPPVDECTPWEELREAHLARLAAQRPTPTPGGRSRPKSDAPASALISFP
ncbi:hypothetical protein [Streptomyces sp. NPDC048269]|uniref:hypothetical protein n=1 Tax=Streptomyces sp. NPDC048269 TaxID=3155753 RepID=UPI003446D8BD